MQFGKPQCSFREKRVLFGTIPLNLLTTKTVRLENNGDCHAHFQVRPLEATQGAKHAQS